nr:response regulator transcription factor [Enterobacter hormaechei]
MTQAIRLMIADDHAIMREGLKQIFLLDDGIKVVGGHRRPGAGTAA